ncbi:hypothetical protein PCC79_09155 [Propioniciclava soli]|uniref:DUF2567 domain-containing protein n=1 Tax=Propioniciclava soli TaxID=2775081 RepID=A0ABZ3C2G2_9ACTN
MGGRQLVNRVGLVVAVALLVGALAALLWVALTQLPAFVVGADGQATIAERAMAQVASADWWFSVLAVVGGLGLGVGVWASLRHWGWPVAFVAVGAAAIAAVTCWLVGETLGPTPFAARMAAATAGEAVPVALRLHALSALALWPFSAVAVCLFASALGPEVGERTRRRRQAVEAGASEPVVEEA